MKAKTRDIFTSDKVLVVGCGKSGAASSRLLQKIYVAPVVYDDKPEQAKKLAQTLDCDFLTKGDLLDATIDVVVVSPGVPLNHPILNQARDLGIEIIGEMEFGLRTLHFHHSIGITGTNGKTTMTFMLNHILKEATSHSVKMMGNVGYPMTAMTQEDVPDISVIEMSSFQLETTQKKFLDVAILLNITSDHLDRYPSMKEYIAAKCHIVELLEKDGELFIFEDVWNEYKDQLSELLPSDSVPNVLQRPSQEWIQKAEKSGIQHLLLRGVDGQAAYLAHKVCLRWGVCEDDFFKALKTFKKPPHRMEFIRTCNGVNFYNDSKATNPMSVEKGLEGFTNHVHLIAGGLSKGCSFEDWKKTLKGCVKQVYALGTAQKQLCDELDPEIKVVKINSLQEAVEMAFKEASQGDHVVLSPGCASFDMFKNYEDRGDQFRRLVLDLKEK